MAMKALGRSRGRVRLFQMGVCTVNISSVPTWRLPSRTSLDNYLLVLEIRMMCLFSKNLQLLWWAKQCLPVGDSSILSIQGHPACWDQLLAHCA